MAVGTLTVTGGKFHLSGNPLKINIAGATIPAGATNYKVLCKVISADSLLIGAPFIDAKTPVSGDAEFDVSGYVDQPIDFEFQYPLTGLVAPRDSHTLDVKFQPGERYLDADGDLVENWGDESETNYVLKGGMSFIDLGKFSDESKTFSSEYVDKLNFLTKIPTDRVVHPFQPNKLCFVANSVKEGRIIFYAWFEDKPEYPYSNPYIHVKNFSTYENIMHEMNASPNTADSTHMAPVVAGVKMLYFDYQINLLDESDPFVSMRFYVDHNYYENCNYLFAVNSLGGMDCIWLNGAVEKGFKVSQVMSVKEWPKAGTRRTRTKIVSNKKGSRTWKINTGYKSAAEMAAMPDLLLSEQVWLLENAATFNEGTLYPVVIANAEALLNNSMDDLHSLELEIEEAHDNKYF